MNASELNSRTVTMLDKPVEVKISRRAVTELAKRDERLCLEMELYFSCLLRKRVRVTDGIQSDFSVNVNDKLDIGFRPVMTKGCSIADTDENGKPPLTDFPIEKPEHYIPHWLKLDYVKGEWRAEFGYLDG